MRVKVDHVTDCVFLPAHAITERDTHSFCDDLAERRKLSLRREFSPASSHHLPRCRWGGAVAVLADGLDGKIKKGDPLSSSFPIRSSVPCNALCSRRARSKGVSAPMISRSRCCWGTAASEITGIAHRSGRRDRTGSPYFHLYSPGLALSRGGSLSVVLPPWVRVR